jgi:hypothetical protein
MENVNKRKQVFETVVYDAARVYLNEGWYTRKYLQELLAAMEAQDESIKKALEWVKK